MGNFLHLNNISLPVTSKQSFWKERKNARYPGESILSSMSISHGDVAFQWKEQSLAN